MSVPALSSTLAESEGEVARWAAEQARSLQSDASSHQRTRAHILEEQAAVQRGIAALELEAEQKSHVTAELQAQKLSLEAEVGELVDAQSHRAAAVAEQQARVAALQAERAALQLEVQALRRGSADANLAQEALLGVYESQLGLRFQRTHNGVLKFVFTKVDEKQLDREFSFDIRIDEQGTYAVAKCRPPVTGLPLLVDVLNETNDLGAFVRRLRDKFRDLVVAAV